MRILVSKTALTLLIVATLLSSCSRNPITGRSQLSLVSEGDMRSLAVTQYKQVIDASKVVKTGPNADMVKRVGSKIAAAITAYYTQLGNASALDGYNWEFNLIDSKEVNAWCMPGGKVVVYTGLLPLTQNETALAIVLGHEITHAVAGHGKERMSQQLLSQQLQNAGDIALGNNPQTVNLFNTLYSPAASVGVLLPNSRKQELEADHYGLIFAAIAGYNPQEAIPFWQRMASMGGQKPPVYLSDHPADQERIAQIQSLMPEALKYYKAPKK